MQKLIHSKIFWYLIIILFTLTYFYFVFKSYHIILQEKNIETQQEPRIKGIISVQTPHSIQDDAILEALENQLGIELDLQFVTENIDVAINKAYAVGNPPDFVGVDKETSILLYKRGILAPLDKLLHKMPEINHTYKPYQLSSGIYEGQLYAIPRIGAFNGKSIWIRTDWMKKVNHSVPETIKDLMDLSDAFANKDPDGNNIRDTFGYSSTFHSVFTVFEPFFGAYGLTGGSNVWIKENQLVYEPIEEEYKQCISEIKDFLANSNADLGLLTNSADEALKKALCGKNGILYTDVQTLLHANFFKRSKEINPNAQWEQINLNQPYLGSNILYEKPLYYGITTQAVNQPKTADKVCQLFDVLSSNEEMSIILESDGNAKYMNGLLIDYLFFTEDEKQILCKKYANYKQDIIHSSHQSRRTVYNHLVPSISTFSKASMDKYISEQLMLFLYGERDLNEYDNFILELKDQYNLDFYLNYARQYLLFDQSLE